MKKMKVDIRTIKTSHELNEEEGKKIILQKIVEMHKNFYKIIHFIMYKMFRVTAETFAKSCVHTTKIKKKIKQ